MTKLFGFLAGQTADTPERRETSGVFFPHRIEAPCDTSRADLFFMENGSSKVYRLNFIADAALKVFEREVINGDVQFPFRGSIENLGKGTVIIVNGRRYLDDQTPGRKVDTIDRFPSGANSGFKGISGSSLPWSGVKQSRQN